MKRNVPWTALIATFFAVLLGLNTNVSILSREFGPTTMRVSSMNLICASPFGTGDDLVAHEDRAIKLKKALASRPGGVDGGVDLDCRSAWLSGAGRTGGDGADKKKTQDHALGRHSTQHGNTSLDAYFGLTRARHADRIVLAAIFVIWVTSS